MPAFFRRFGFRTLLWLAAVSASVAAGGAPAAGVDDAGWASLHDGAIVLLRHATAPGIGDPANFRLGDCATQRNLDASGRGEAVRIGAAFRAHDIRVDRVWASRWCRTQETAELSFPGRVVAEPAFDSFFDDASTAPRQTARARALLAAWRGPGVLVVVTHQVNITALTGVVPAAGEAVVVVPDGAAVRVVTRISPAR